MFSRPKPGDDEDDILRMQEEFHEEKIKNENLNTAAWVTSLRPNLSQSSNKTGSVNKSLPGPSRYALRKGLKLDKNGKSSDSTTYLMGNVVEKNTNLQSEDDKVHFPKIIPSVLGDIIEKNVEHSEELSLIWMPSAGFPLVPKQDLCSNNVNNTQVGVVNNDKMDVDLPNISISHSLINNTLNLPDKSYIIGSENAVEVHKDNINILNKMSEKDILEEQKMLMSNLNPSLLEFVKLKRKNCQSVSQQLHTEDIENNQNNKNEQLNIKDDIVDDDSLWQNDVLSHPNVTRWLHFDSLEKDKLEWMKSINESKITNPEEPYEARFNLKGYLLPYTLKYNEETKILFHHGSESHRPGYSLSEIIELTRSAVIQQRVIALNMIAGILEYYCMGAYKNIIDIPISKIFFVIRFALDENKEIILEPALKAMRNLLFNRIDEASLDALIGFEESMEQPCLENDKEEIKELESKEDELKDFHLAEIDMISAVLRTDIVQRISYILNAVQPNINCVQYCLQILIRLSRDSTETSKTIVGTDHLINRIIVSFIPKTSLGFLLEPKISHSGKPLLAALKLLRVLTLQSEAISAVLNMKYGILDPIAHYISSGVDGTYSLRLQIEALNILSNQITFGHGIEVAIALLPIIVTNLYKHVQGTNIFFNSSVISATHAAVVLQLVNRIFQYNLPNTDSFRGQVYPLLKEGIQKWLGQLSISENYTSAHLRLLCAALDCCRTIMVLEKISIPFLNNNFKTLAASKLYTNMMNLLETSSNLLSGIDITELNLTKNLKTLGCSVIGSDKKVLPILDISSPIPFLASLFKVLEVIDDPNIINSFVTPLQRYFSKLATRKPSLADNWFTRIETKFIFSAIKIATRFSITEEINDLLFAVANKLCFILRCDMKTEIEYLFSNILFNKNWFAPDKLVNILSLSDVGCSSIFDSIEHIKQCYSDVINLQYTATGPNVVVRKWQDPILPRDWIYLPILQLYSRNLENYNSNCKKSTETKEFIVKNSLEWILFNELCFPELLDDIEITDRFCRIMCVYLCDSSLFLDSKIKFLLEKSLQVLFKKEKKSHFNFDMQLVGLNNFQDFYTQFLEQFQSVSYGDFTFASCVFVPLAQRHNVKWRKLLWSEYAGCLRALDCPEDLLCYEFTEYLYPEENDESLIKCYIKALNSNLLRANTLTHKIATHQVQCYKKRYLITS